MLPSRQQDTHIGLPACTPYPPWPTTASCSQNAPDRPSRTRASVRCTQAIPQLTRASTPVPVRQPLSRVGDRHDRPRITADSPEDIHALPVTPITAGECRHQAHHYQMQTAGAQPDNRPHHPMHQFQVRHHTGRPITQRGFRRSQTSADEPLIRTSSSGRGSSALGSLRANGSAWLRLTRVVGIDPVQCPRSRSLHLTEHYLPDGDTPNSTPGQPVRSTGRVFG
jgi:hypothetical protein